MKTLFISVCAAVLFAGGSLGLVQAQTRANVPPKTQETTPAPKMDEKASTKKMPAKKDGKGGKKINGKMITPLKGILLTPPETSGGVSDQLTDDIIRVIQRKLEATGEYNGVFMRRSLSTIKRGLTDQTLTSGDVEKPFTLNTKLQKLSTITGYKLLITSSVGEYKYDEDKKTVTLDMTLRLVDFSTGKLVTKTASETITGKPGTKGQTEVQIALDTVRDATEKLSQQLLYTKF